MKEDTKLIPQIADGVTEVATRTEAMALSMADNEDTPVVGRLLTIMSPDTELLERRAVVDWLSPLNFFPTHDSIIGRRRRGTGQWFLDFLEY
jgi:hypothetical protein